LERLFKPEPFPEAGIAEAGRRCGSGSDAVTIDSSYRWDGRWRLSRAFALGAAIGAVGGALWGWIDYGTFDIGRFSGYVLGGLFIVGFVFLAIAALRNWLRRNPL
jgi:hypothetical protein